MYEILLFIQIISLLLLGIGSVLIFMNWKNKSYSYLFMYCLFTLLNNAGYIMEMTATNSEAALKGTQMSYMGKVYIPIFFMLVIFNLCKVKVPKLFTLIMFTLHVIILILVMSCNHHSLYYTSITFTEEGLFPHNVYGHGIVYNIYMIAIIVYFVIAFCILVKSIKNNKSSDFKAQARCVLTALIVTLLSFVMFMAGITGGYDTTTLGYMISAVFFSIAVLRYRLLDALDLVKDYAIDNLADGVAAINDQGEIIYYNVPFKKIYPKVDEQKEELIKKLDNIIAEKENIYRDNAIYRPSIKPLMHRNNLRGQMYIISDMTESLKYTMELKRQKEIAEEASNSKSAFLSNMSHEIRTPMNAIVGIAEILLRNDYDAETISYLENIKNSGDALLSIINDILDFSKIESGKMEIVEDDYDLRRLIEELDIVFKTRIGSKPVEMRYEIDKDIPKGLHGDEVRIRQIIINLVNNAIKFTEEGFVKVSVKLDSREGDNAVITISVKDTGQGIKEDDIEKLFGSYQQVDTRKNHKKEGTGLGLAICKQLVKLMGGTIHVESVYGKGSKFYFTIPQIAIDHEIKKNEESDRGFKAPDAKILVVDDSDMNLKVFKGLFSPLGMTIDTAENGREAVEKVKLNTYDVVFMDHMMPIMDGVEATLKIRALPYDYYHTDAYYKSLPIIALSANATEEAKALFENSHMNGFASKPVKVKEIYTILRNNLPKEKIIEDYEPDIHEEESDNKLFAEVVNESEIDKKEGLENCGSKDLYNSLVEDFYKLIDSKINKVKSYMDDNAIKNFTIEVHALKSSARMIGARKISELFLHLEELGNKNDVEGIKRETPDILERLRNLKTTIENEFGIKEDNSDDRDKEQVDNEKIKSVLNSMIDAVNNFNLDDIDEAMEVLNSYRMPDSIKEKYEELSISVSDVDMEKILKIVNECLEKL